MTSPAGLDIVASNPCLRTGIDQPRALVDGRALRLRWGTNPIPLPPGRHQVQVSVAAPVASRGQAALVVDVAPGQWIRVYYSAPPSITAAGTIGLTPASPNGRNELILLLVMVSITTVLLLVSEIIR